MRNNPAPVHLAVSWLGNLGGSSGMSFSLPVGKEGIVLVLCSGREAKKRCLIYSSGQRAGTP